MNDSPFFHKKDKKIDLYAGFKRHDERCREFEKRFPGKTVKSFLTWFYKEKGVHLPALSSNDLILAPQIALKKLEECDWNIQECIK